MSARKPRERRSHYDGQAVRIDRPEPGLYKTRLWPTPPGERVAWIPAIIYALPSVHPPEDGPEAGRPMDRPPTLHCVVNGEERDPWAEYLHLYPCDETTYEQLCRVHDSACECVVAAMWNPEWSD